MDKKLNHETREKLDSMYKDLTPKAWNVISSTDINVMYECFGGLETPEEVNQYIDENYTD